MNELGNTPADKNYKPSGIFNEITETFVRHHELLFGNGRIYQGETNGLMETRFVDVTEDVAKAIAKYISPR